jgi:hypothetical protein
MASRAQMLDIEERLVFGTWPRREEGVRRQNLHPLVPESIVRAMAPGEVALILLAPPFRMLASEASAQPDFWAQHGALDELDPRQAVIIADFGLGSDAVVVVDLRTSPAPVLRLRWGEDGNHWIVMAPTLEQFRAALPLDP